MTTPKLFATTFEQNARAAISWMCRGAASESAFSTSAATPTAAERLKSVQSVGASVSFAPKAPGRTA